MTVYLTVAEVAEIHQIMIDQFGGAPGLRDIGALESALFRPQSGYYADLIAEACALLESLAMNHPFVDGNKRTAAVVAETFLVLNGYALNATDAELVVAVLALAAGELSEEELADWFRGHLAG